MSCPSCGGHSNDSEYCDVCNNLADDKVALPGRASQRTRKNKSASQSSRRSRSSGRKNKRQESRLIAFPGVSQPAVPAWRKELSERVREVQERRARELAQETEKLELEKAKEQSNQRPSTPLLEMLRQGNTAPVNPIVVAALRRIERANQPPLEPAPTPQVKSAVAVAVACVQQSHVGNGGAAAETYSPVQNKAESPTITAPEPEEVQTTTEPVERKLNLVTAPPKVTVSIDKPRRLIVDDPNDPVLNYLDSIPTAVRVEDTPFNQASAFRRFVAGTIDLVVGVFLASPLLAAIELAYKNWNDPLTLGLAVGSFVLASFLYATIATALTGRTLGMKLLAIRVIDTRTGLIPTGSQSAGRALIYLASFLTLGIGTIYALVDQDKRTAHDRLTQTAVIRS